MSLPTFLLTASSEMQMNLARCVDFCDLAVLHCVNTEISASKADTLLWCTCAEAQLPQVTVDEALFSQHRQSVLECCAHLLHVSIANDTTLKLDDVEEVQHMANALRVARCSARLHLARGGQMARVFIGKGRIEDNVLRSSVNSYRVAEGGLMEGLPKGSLLMKLGARPKKLMMKARYVIANDDKDARIDAAAENAWMDHPRHIPFHVNVSCASRRAVLSYRGAPLRLDGQSRSTKDGFWVVKKSKLQNECDPDVACVMTVFDGLPEEDGDNKLLSALQLEHRRVRRIAS
eukprot:TRINITY_DN38830_c0_g1_i1.p1 TRINITY_DN38830_c0_g1~~TRINITY_DN38830_c0_g1_i1.p1  ORF type:complete len:290 (-),score=53.28 TRINITY_DN38830_c0_g1_i1:190-1059(-)